MRLEEATDAGDQRRRWKSTAEAEIDGGGLKRPKKARDDRGTHTAFSQEDKIEDFPYHVKEKEEERLGM